MHSPHARLPRAHSCTSAVIVAFLIESVPLSHSVHNRCAGSRWFFEFSRTRTIIVDYLHLSIDSKDERIKLASPWSISLKNFLPSTRIVILRNDLLSRLYPLMAHFCGVCNSHFSRWLKENWKFTSNIENEWNQRLRFSEMKENSIFIDNLRLVISYWEMTI